MVTLFAVYRSPVSEVLKIWNERASELGLELVGPLEQGHTFWDTVFLQGVGLYTSVRHQMESEIQPEATKIRIAGTADLAEPLFTLLQKLLDWPVRPVEAGVLDKSHESPGPLLSEPWFGIPCRTILSEMGRKYRCGIRQVRLIRQDLVAEPQAWPAYTQANQIEMRPLDTYLLLDVCWDERGHAVPEPSELWRLAWKERRYPKVNSEVREWYPQEDAMYCYLESVMAKSPQGTVLTAQTYVDGSTTGTGRSRIIVLPEGLSRTLWEILRAGDLVSRYCSSGFAIIRPGLPKAQAHELVGEVKGILSRHYGVAAHPLLGHLYSASWPDDRDDIDNLLDALDNFEAGGILTYL